MQHLKMIITLFGYLMLLLQVNSQSTDIDDSMATLVFEDPSQVQYNIANIDCVSYEPTGLCSEVLSMYDHPVQLAVNTSSQNISLNQGTADTFLRILQSLDSHKQCSNVLKAFICHWVFATCDPAYNVSVHQQICQRGCDILSTIVCPDTWNRVITQRSILNFRGFQPPDCSDQLYSNGGEAPDCIDPTDGGEIPEFVLTGDCFTGLGRGYNGTINVTRSGKTCQRWSEQAPHRFILPSEQYPEIAGGHNYCRNPGSRAPDGPWCFTTDPDTRWEYCDVPNCNSSISCELYNNSRDAVCYRFRSIGKDYVYVNKNIGTIDQLNSRLIDFSNTLETLETENPNEDCRDLILGLMCHNAFPLCDYSSNNPMPRQVCRSYCDEISTRRCRDMWIELTTFSDIQTVTLPICSSLPSTEGGEYLECFIPYNHGLVRTNSTSDCYIEDDRGINYNGTQNTTISGKTCQAWDSTIPHFHPFTSLYRPYLEDHNYCRNPEGHGNRPWCYTQDPSMRWEYCNVRVCLLASGDDDESNNTAIIALAVVLPLLLIIVLMSILVLFILRTIKKKEESKTYKSGELNKNGTARMPLQNSFMLDPTLADSDQLPVIPIKNITYISELGEGFFGKVMKGEVKNIIPGQYSTLVAIKILKEGSTGNAKNDFIREAVLVNQFDHPNILKLLGVCFEQEPYCIAFEYMELGDLNNFLRNKAVSVSQPTSNLTIQQLINMAINIAAGLEYLAMRHFVHRDLATRNCLINHQLSVKISDFGLSKDVYSKDYYRFGDKSVLPIRWMPPEAIVYSKFTTQSDVWSFGIVLWEIFSGGAQPYYTLSNEEVIEYVTHEKMLRCPYECPSEIYDLMVDCWATNPTDRLTAAEVHAALKNWNPRFSLNNATTYKAPEAQGYVKMASARSSLHDWENNLVQLSRNGSLERGETAM